MEEFLKVWSYLGIFVGILLTGLGFPMPEELPIVIGGGLVGFAQANFLMLPVCIIGVIIGDSFLYFIGRIWGAKLVERPFIKKRLLTPSRLESIRANFKKHGIKILLFARLTPGIRAPIFFTAGIIRLPIHKFLLADAIYAVPGVSLLFFLGYFFGDQMIGLIHQFDHVVKAFIIMAVLAGVAGYFTYRYLRRLMVTGDPQDVPAIVHRLEQTLEKVTDVVMPEEMEQKETAATVKEESGEPRT